MTTLLENEIYRSMYEGYLKEIAEKYFTQEYMTELVTKIHDLIAPYVQNDPTAFCTYEEFEQACSTDPTDQYSLVYYAVNMAESIENQLNGGEPTFNTSSMQGGGFGGGKQSDFNGEMPDMASRTEQTTDAQQNAQQNDRPTPPDQNGGQQGGQMDEMSGVDSRAVHPISAAVKRLLPVCPDRIIKACAFRIACRRLPSAAACLWSVWWF